MSRVGLPDQASTSRLSVDSATTTASFAPRLRPRPPPTNGSASLPVGSSRHPRRAGQYGIASVLHDASAGPSLLPAFPSLAANPYVPASLSSLGTAFSSSALPRSSGESQVAQRRSRAPPVRVSELRRVDPREFEAYLAQVGPEYDRWERERSLGKNGEADLGDGDGDGGRGSSRRRVEEQLPPLEGVPRIFFDSAFTLANPRTFDLVTERIQLAPSSPTLRPLASPSPPPPPTEDPSPSPTAEPGLGPLTLADLATDQLLQEKLSHYTAVIESHLVREIGLRSASFFAALSNLQSLHQQGEACLSKIAQLQAALEPGVGRVAKRGLSVLRKQARRRALERIERGVRQVDELWSGLEGVKELVEQGEWSAALEVGEQVESAYFATGATLDLTRIGALRAVPDRLAALRAQVAKSLEAELVSVLAREMEVAVNEFVEHSDEPGWTTRVGGEESGQERVRERARDRARPVLSALVRADGMDGAVASWRESVLRDVRAKVREYLPTSETPTAEDEDAFAQAASRPGLDLGSVSEKSVSLAKALRALPAASFLALAVQTYRGLLGTIEVIELHSSVILDLANSFAPRRTRSPQPSLTIPGSLPPTSPTPERDSSTLATDVADVLHAAAELANLRFSKVIGVRTEVHAQLALDDFVAIFDASWNFVVSCEVRCQRMIVGLRGVMVGQAKAFLQAFHQKRLTESARRVEEEQWGAADVGARTRRVVRLILESAVSDPVELLLGVRGNGRPTNGKDDDDNDGGPPTKQLDIDGREYFAVAAGLATIDVLADYLMVVVNCPLLTTDAMSKVVEFLKSFNSRTCQVVLGAGAMRSAGLKNITAKHLALASQALSIMISLIPYIRETLRRHLNPKQAVLLVEFDKLKRDYQEHQNEIHSKLVAIMSDRLQVHCKTLEGVDWDAGDDKPNGYMEALVKEHVTLHKVLSRFLQAPTVEFIMGQVFSALNVRLADEFGRIDVRTERSKRAMLVDVRFLKTKLGELKGLERETPGTELEHLVESKITPEATKAGHSRRESLANVPAASLPTSPILRSLSPERTPPPRTPDAPESTPVLTAPTSPPAPARRKSMAERLAEISRRGRGQQPPMPVAKDDLPTVPDEEQVALVVPSVDGNELAVQPPVGEDMPPSTPDKEFSSAPPTPPVEQASEPPVEPAVEQVELAVPVGQGDVESAEEVVERYEDVVGQSALNGVEDPNGVTPPVPDVVVDSTVAEDSPPTPTEKSPLVPTEEPFEQKKASGAGPATTNGNGHAPVAPIEVEVEVEVEVEPEIEEEESSFV